MFISMAWRWLCCFTFFKKTAQRCCCFPVFGQLGCVTLHLFVFLVDYLQQGVFKMLSVTRFLTFFIVLNSDSACYLFYLYFFSVELQVGLISTDLPRSAFN